MKKAYVAIFLVLLLSGCAKSQWYEHYGINEGTLHLSESQDKLIELLSYNDVHTRDAALETLLTIKPFSEKVAQALEDYSETQNTTFAGRIGILLMKGGAKKHAVKPLIRALQDNEKTYTIVYLGEIGGEAKSALPILENIAKNGEENVQRVAEQAIRKILFDLQKN